MENGTTSSEETSLLTSSRKPPRVFRTGRKRERDPGHLGEAACFETLAVNSGSDKHARCPAECPFYASDKTDDQHCTFVCVPAEDCIRYNPKAPVADADDGVCRSPMANYCEEYELSGLDRCSVCKSGYVLDPEDGQCHFKHYWAIHILIVILLVLVVVLVAWLINLGCRPITNKTGLQDGLSYRSSCKLSQPTQSDGSRPRWPISTNLMTNSEVAGPGMMLHFNFQFNLILWAFGVGLAWVIVSYIQDPTWSRSPDLMRLGTRKMGYPRDNCILVAWGYETQQRLMWIKILFLLVVYLVTFALCIWHSVRQHRLFEVVDSENSTMTDFAALLEGLPLMSGSDMAEDAIAAAVREQTGQKVIGVSIAWDFQDHEEKVVEAAKANVYAYDEWDKRGGDGSSGAASSGDPINRPAAEVQHTGLQKHMFDAESWLLEEPTDKDPPHEQKEEEIRQVLEDMKSTEFAFVVFETEDARNRAVDKLEQKGGLEFKDSVARIAHVRAEPDTVLWENFGHSDTSQIVARLAAGFGLILLALVVWTLLFYGPYAWSIFQFNYDNGQQPGFIYGFAFSMVVVVGNAIMYEVCARVSDFVGFHFRDKREACYMILYTIATSFNVLLDFVTTYYTVWEVSKGLGFRTYYGQKVKEITSFTEAFETYAMQRQLGENTYTYAFPSTFLIPFLIEPIVTIYVPLKLGVMLVRTHPKITGSLAEGWLASAPMDMGRYADCLLNVVLAVLVLYFPGGWTWRLYFAMGMCHMFIYAFDHWKVLSNIPKCTYASMDVDWWSQALLAPCTAGILSCLIFKMNCQDYGFCLDGVPLIMACTAGFWAHCVVHVLVLVYVVPLFAAREVVGQDAETTTFQDVATYTACSWFTSNPVHCLRSKYKYKHDPECAYYIVGKDHCIQKNPAANVYYVGSRTEEEDYEESFAAVSQMSVEVKDNLKNLLQQIRMPSNRDLAQRHDGMPNVDELTPAAKAKLVAAAARLKARREARASEPATPSGSRPLSDAAAAAALSRPLSEAAASSTQ